MDDEDNGFFLLVLGVLAAILAVISWWFLQRDSTPSLPINLASVDTHALDEPNDETTAQGSEPAKTAVTVADVIAGGEHRKFDSMLARLSIAETLTETGPFTVLAPTDAAIEAMDPLAAPRLLGINSAERTIKYHILDGDYSYDKLVAAAEDSGGTAELVTLSGETIRIESGVDGLRLNAAAVITRKEQRADNGLVHSLDQVLISPEAALNLLVASEPIRFASGSADIDAGSIPVLDQAIAALQDSAVEVTIEGHTDDEGDALFNINLSQLRAEAVVRYFVAQGIEPERLRAIGYGSSSPIADNATEEGRAENRRIEFRLSN